MGITRTTRAPGKAASTVTVGMPAMMLTTSVPGLTCGAYTGQAAVKLCGLTAITTVPASATASAGAVTVP